MRPQRSNRRFELFHGSAALNLVFHVPIELRSRFQDQGGRRFGRFGLTLCQGRHRVFLNRSSSSSYRVRVPALSSSKALSVASVGIRPFANRAAEGARTGTVG